MSPLVGSMVSVLPLQNVFRCPILIRLYIWLSRKVTAFYSSLWSLAECVAHSRRSVAVPWTWALFGCVKRGLSLESKSNANAICTWGAGEQQKQNESCAFSRDRDELVTVLEVVTTPLQRIVASQGCGLGIIRSFDPYPNPHPPNQENPEIQMFCLNFSDFFFRWEKLPFELLKYCGNQI